MNKCKHQETEEIAPVLLFYAELGDNGKYTPNGGFVCTPYRCKECGRIEFSTSQVVSFDEEHE